MFFKFKSKTIYGLDIGNSSIKSSHINFSGKSGKLIDFKIQGVSPGQIKNGEVLDSASLTKSVSSLVSQIKAKKLAMGISGSAVMVKRITVPKMDTNLLPEQVRWEAEQYIPYNIEEVVLDYISLPIKEESDGMDIVLIAAQKSKIKDFSSLALGRGGVSVEVVDVASFALANIFMTNYPELRSSTIGLLDIGAFYTHFVVLDKGNIAFSRDIPSGGGIYDEEIAKNLGVTELEAQAMKEKAKESALPDIAADTIASVSSQFSGQILGSYDFFRETTPGVEAKEFFVTGGASLTVGLVESLSTALSLKVSYMDLFKQINPNSKVINENDNRDLQYKSAVSMGLALHKLGS